MKILCCDKRKPLWFVTENLHFVTEAFAEAMKNQLKKLYFVLLLKVVFKKKYLNNNGLKLLEIQRDLNHFNINQCVSQLKDF